tara:strand:+ start:312 stop:509 length:198 start_codon:yes stop_codon:yes gene_type:complete
MSIIILVYLICFAATLGAAFAFMWRSMGEVFKQDTKPTFTSHPELKGMKKGEKLLVFRAEEKDEV